EHTAWPGASNGAHAAADSRGRSRPTSGLPVALLDERPERAQARGVGADGPSRPRMVVPAEEIEVQPARALAHELAQEERRRDRAGELDGRRVLEVGDLALEVTAIAAVQRKPPDRVAHRSGVACEIVGE